MAQIPCTTVYESKMRKKNLLRFPLSKDINATGAGHHVISGATALTPKTAITLKGNF